MDDASSGKDDTRGVDKDTGEGVPLDVWVASKQANLCKYLEANTAVSAKTLENIRELDTTAFLLEARRRLEPVSHLLDPNTETSAILVALDGFFSSKVEVPTKADGEVDMEVVNTLRRYATLFWIMSNKLVEAPDVN